MAEPELGHDSDGCQRYLQVPFPLTLELIEDEFSDLFAIELGRALKIGAWWWFYGRVPSARGLSSLLGLQGARGRAVVEAHAHRFAPGSTLAGLREKEIAKVRRRLKLDALPKRSAVVLPFPGGGAKV